MASRSALAFIVSFVSIYVSVQGRHKGNDAAGNRPVSMASASTNAAIKAAVAKAVEKKMKDYPGIGSLEELLEWNISNAGPKMGATKELPVLPDGGRILSMHDMAGGYKPLADNDYLNMFQSWEYIDLFVYFSHVRLAVPPLQWTAVAHEHKTAVLATIIFEGSDGTEALYSNRSAVLKKMVDVAEHYGFDGWFVNIEGGNWKNGDPANFVSELKDAMHTKFGKRSQVIAYPYGPEDQAMFAAADGVFINYNWPEDHASMSRVAKAAGSRTHDVYMGMDAFGGRRGNTQPDPHHMNLTGAYNLSAAVFAPGFTLEVPAHGVYSQRAVDYDKRYWASIAKNFGRNVTSDMKDVKWPVNFADMEQQETTRVRPQDMMSWNDMNIDYDENVLGDDADDLSLMDDEGDMPLAFSQLQNLAWEEELEEQQQKTEDEAQDEVNDAEEGGDDFEEEAVDEKIDEAGLLEEGEDEEDADEIEGEDEAEDDSIDEDEEEEDEAE